MPKGPATAAEVAEVTALLRDVCERLAPSAIGLHEASAVFDDLAAAERLAGGAVVRMSARYEEAGEWKRNGARSAEEAISRKTGTGIAQARRKLGTSKRLGAQRHTDDALRRGEVSQDQAVEVSDAAVVAPGSEVELLASARREPLHQLRQRAAEAKAAADEDREATRRRLHAARRVRRWDDGDGMASLLLQLAGDELREIDAALQPGLDRRVADARAAGRFEPVEAYLADEVRDRLLGRTTTPARGGVVEAVDGEIPDAGAGGGLAVPGSQAVRPEKKVIVLIDIEALNRGRVEGDETCVVAGVGPVSVTAARRLMGEAFWAVVIRDGVDVRNVTHLGRRVTAHQRTALEARGGRCEFCGSTFRVEIDHVEGWSLTHRTTLGDLSFKCWHCHQLEGRHRLRETGPPGDRRFLNPDGTPWRPPPGERSTDPPGDPPDQPDLFTLAD